MTDVQMALPFEPIAAPDPVEWPKPQGRGKKCTRDPEAGAGSCWLWWEGCPKAEQRGCYQHWFHQKERGKP